MERQSFYVPIILLILLLNFESQMMFSDNPFESGVFLVFAVAAAIQLFYYLYFYLSVSLHNQKVNKGDKKSVSVIICARNEAENLRNFLPSVLSQEYADYEVIVVNDCSEDDTFDVLGNLLIKYPHLKISNVNKDPEFTHNKKFAQFIGIKASKNEILLFTDADCQPESKLWIEKMTSHFSQGTDFVLGYGGYRKEVGLLNNYIRYDSFFIAIQYLGMALRGVPYMGVGRNLAYRRSLFFDNKGFGPHNHVVSGDDDLFVNSNATQVNTYAEFSREAHTRSVPSNTFEKWVLQKKRHFTTAPYYKLRDRFLLFLEPLTRLAFYVSFIVTISMLFLWQLALAIFGLRLICQIITFSLGQKKLNEPGMVGYSLFFDIFSPFINGYILASNLRNKPGKNQWK
jgi:glycosyltransferase involved in cell wall biosynthesis